MMDPGAMALTRIPCGASASAMDRVRLCTPPLDALYPAMVGMAVTPLTLPMLMMAPPRPCLTICLAACCPVRNTPLRLTLMTSSKSFSVISRNGAALTMPALEMTMSTPPSFSTVNCTSFSTSAVLETSHANASTLFCCVFISIAAFDAVSKSASASTTLAPRLQSARAHASPMPRAPPVTMATFDANETLNGTAMTEQRQRETK
mmetsp:Transcript_5785/g.13267  ORF Transcript_5785/g.13267 Transcript_5785/m.13267 type:complete len:205 (+) Transcript_5785:1118-1732(+)